MLYSSQRLSNAFIHSSLVAACIGSFLFSAQCKAAELLNVDAIEFQTTDCWIKLDSKARTDCGWLIVPENWEHPDAQRLKLPVVIYRALNPDPTLVPIIYLSGGPGIAALGKNGGSIRGHRSWADHSFPGRTLIVFDQRGTGLGSAKLECRNGDGPMVWYPVSKNPEKFGNIPSRVHAAYAACAERYLAEGRQLSAFNTLQSATDVEALRRALKLKSIVLFGISYGTRLALTVMKHYPQNIKAAILDSVWPPKADSTVLDSTSFGPVLDRLFQACHQDKSCAAAYPDLRDRFLRVLDKLAEEPVILEITNLEDREPLYARIDHTMFLEIIRNEMGYTERLPNLPVLISGVAQGEYWRLKAHVENTVYSGWPADLDMGASLAVLCNDDVGVAYRQPNFDDAASYPYLRDYAASGRDASPCAIWPTKANTGNRDVVVSDVPSLLLAGALDASTTIEHAELAAETLSVSHLFVFPANAHVQIKWDECSWEIIDEFLSRPTRRPNPKCLTSLRQPAFLTYGGN